MRRDGPLKNKCQRKKTCLVVFILMVFTSLGLASPMPLEDASNITRLSGREGYHISPDGQWIAYTVSLSDTVKRYGRHSRTGAGLGSGANRRQARVTHLDSGKTFAPGGDEAFSWGPQWCPDGSQLALFTDEKGKVALKVGDMKGMTGRVYDSVIPRVQFYFQNLQWHPNGGSIALLSLPPGDPLVPELSEENARAVRVWNSKKPEKQTIDHWSYA